MDLIDQLSQLAGRVPKLREHLKTEEASKTALVLPFLSALGYNVFDPTEVVPEFNADIGTKKGEKVDYVIMKEAKPIILIECKSLECPLNPKNASQLFRYFTTTEARFAVLTNGIYYRFFTDLDKPNMMDDRPFLEFDITQLDEPLVLQIKKFSKNSFDLDNILSDASDLKYTKEIKRHLQELLDSPTEEFVKILAGNVYNGRFTAPVMDQFKIIVARAFRDFINDKVNQRLKTALDAGPQELVSAPSEEEPNEPDATERKSKIVTTDEEIQGYNIVRAILCSEVEIERITMRDKQSYCGVLLDDNNRKPICRMHFNRSQKYIGIFDNDKNEERLPIEKVEDIYKYADKLIATIRSYTTTQPAGGT